MRYVISIDWLSLYCYNTRRGEWEGLPTTGELGGAYPWGYWRENYGTRHYKHLTKIAMPNEQGGADEFAEVQSEPCSGVIAARSVIVRFVNRALYRHDFWELADMFLRDNGLEFRSISRVDVCADFNGFATLTPLRLIEGFASKQYRHVGRGVGALYFDHGVRRDPLDGLKRYGVHYTGLSFGTHSSDARVYLYNKSFELATQGDKPWIKDRWRSVGLNMKEVWRLEVSLKSKACTFRDATFKQKVRIDTETCKSDDQLAVVFHSFARKLFSFVRNREGITNISREPRIKLFDGGYWIERNVLRNVTGSNRLDRMVIKALYTMADVYRGDEVRGCSGYAETLANVIADATDLSEWLMDKSQLWDVKTHR